MAYDKVVDSAKLDADLTELAKAIRAKSGLNAILPWPDGFKSAINSMNTVNNTMVYTDTVSCGSWNHASKKSISFATSKNIGDGDIFFAFRCNYFYNSNMFGGPSSQYTSYFATFLGYRMGEVEASYARSWASGEAVDNEVSITPGITMDNDASIQATIDGWHITFSSDNCYMDGEWRWVHIKM